MAITARIQNTRSARRTALRAARQERCASATRSSAAVSPVLMEDHPQLEALHHQGSQLERSRGPGPRPGAREAGELSKDADVDALARFLVDSYEGAAARAKLIGDRAPMDEFIRTTFDFLLA